MKLHIHGQLANFLYYTHCHSSGLLRGTIRRCKEVISFYFVLMIPYSISTLNLDELSKIWDEMREGDLYEMKIEI